MPSLSTEFLESLGYALCERREDGKFSLLYEPPGWFQQIWGPGAAAGNLLALTERSPFLEGFLADAEEHWDSNAESPLESGAWIEQGSAGGEIPVEARAWRIGGKRILSLHSGPQEFRERTRVLQTARDSLLVHERLLKEIQKKEILLHCIIHDLSQPLTAMRGCFDVLARDAVTPGAKRLIDLGRQQSERQDSMIREVLQAFAADIDSAQGGGEATRDAPSILTCAEETAAAFAPVFESHGAQIRLDPQVDRSAPWNVRGDTSRLMRIFSNLVENALRHAPRGTAVTIGLEDDAGHVKAFVDDEGPGLPQEFKPAEAFALFSKGKQGGGEAGLGLYFCRMTVERWGGSIGCESLPHRGARFWFRLPRAAGAPQAPAVSRETRKSAVAAPRPLQVLLADDDAAVRELTGILLQRDGHKVVTVVNGIEALRAVAKQGFDALLLDEEMPGISGVEVTKKIRAREEPGGKHQIIFAVTGNTTDEDRTRLLAAGFDACLGKPFRAEQLREIAAFHFPGVSAPPLREQAPAAATHTDSSLLARVGGDAKLLRNISKMFLKDYPAKVSKIKRAIARKDAPGLASAAHALKGAVAIFGAEDAVEVTREMQQMGRRGVLTSAKAAYRKLDEALARLDAKLREYAPPVSRKSSRSGRPPRKSRRNARRAPRR